MKLWLNYGTIKSQNKRRNEYENYSDERFKKHSRSRKTM